MNRLKWGIAIGVLLILGSVLGISISSSVRADGGDADLNHHCVEPTTGETRTAFPGPRDANFDCAAVGWTNVHSGDIAGVTAGTGLLGGGTIGAVTLDADTTFLQQRVSGTCAAESSIQGINSDGTVICETDDVGLGGLGTVNHIAKFTGATTIGDSGIFETPGGRVGIGTFIPSSQFDVEAATTNTDVEVTNTSGTAGRSRILMNISDREWRLINDGNLDIFKIKDQTAGVTRLAIDYDGQIGIGTSDPKAPLHIKGEALFLDTLRVEDEFFAALRLKFGTGGTGQIEWYERAIPRAGIAWDEGNNNGMLFYTDGVNRTDKIRMAIKKNGDIGIGTLDPSSLLDLEAATINTDVEVTNTSGTAGRSRILMNISDREWRIVNDGDLDLFKIRDQTAGITRVAIDYDGQVGIGTLDPTAVLHVVSSGVTPSFLAANGTSDYAVPVGQNMQFGHWDGATSTFTERMKINGVGTVQVSVLEITSDRDAKMEFATVDGRDILERLSEIPIETWNLKRDDASIRHMGPMAQDFKAAFRLGSDDKHISTTDLDGVALAAIQGLHEMVLEKDAKIAALQGRIGEMEARMETLEQVGGAQTRTVPFGPPIAYMALGGLFMPVLLGLGYWRIKRARGVEAAQ